MKQRASYDPAEEGARAARADVARAQEARGDFRPFDADDWKRFVGCEHPRPLIAERDGLTIVLAGATAEAHLVFAEPQEEVSGLIFARTFADGEAVAEAVARSAMLAEHVDEQLLEGLFGEAIGDF